MEDGSIKISDSAFTPQQTPLRLSISQYPLTAHHQVTAHKVSHRDFYEGERHRLKAQSGCDEVVFLNANGELCEGSFTNLFIEKDGRLLTPSLEAGLLPGVLRAHMIASGQAEACRLTYDDLIDADAIYAGNSLRGLMTAMLISEKRL